jgi:uncharacterized protein (TIGR02145 family)
LTGGTTYYVRAYATNSSGTGSGDQVSFTTVPPINFNPNLTYGTVSDIEGNIYKTIQIFSQIWMAENLKVTKYQNGDLIGTTTRYADYDISNEISPKYQWAYYGDESNVNTYGRSYTWFAVTDRRNVCPTGWHVPTLIEWTTLTTYLGGYGVAEDKLKETGTTNWLAPNKGATNSSGFTALPSGFRSSNGAFNLVGQIGGWWSSTESSTTYAYYPYILYDYGIVFRSDTNKKTGFSVRCLKD